MTLENVFPGLSAAAPETTIAVAKHLIAAERCPAPVVWIWRGSSNPQCQGGHTFRACPPPGRRTTSTKADARSLNPICLAASASQEQLNGFFDMSAHFLALERLKA